MSNNNDEKQLPDGVSLVEDKNVPEVIKGDDADELPVLMAQVPDSSVSKHEKSVGQRTLVAESETVPPEVKVRTRSSDRCMGPGHEAKH